MRAFGRLLAAGVALVLVASALPAQAADSVDPIDAALAKCLDAPDGQTTAGMVTCLDTAYTAWDQALNDAYNNLFDLLDADSLAKLKASQRKWIAFSDAERAFLASMAKPENGTLMRVVAVQGLVDVVKVRTLQLRAIEQ